MGFVSQFWRLALLPSCGGSVWRSEVARLWEPRSRTQGKEGQAVFIDFLPPASPTPSTPRYRIIGDKMVSWYPSAVSRVTCWARADHTGAFGETFHILPQHRLWLWFRLLGRPRTCRWALDAFRKYSGTEERGEHLRCEQAVRANPQRAKESGVSCLCGPFPPNSSPAGGGFGCLSFRAAIWWTLAL